MSFPSLETNLVSSSVWNAFLAHFNADEDLRNCLDPKSDVCEASIAKWSEDWVKIHQKAIEVADLLPFFGNANAIRYSGVDTSMSKVLEDKKRKRINIPDDATRSKLYSFYKSCIDQCPSLADLPLTRQNLMESVDLNIGQQMYTLRNYPWVTFTPEAPIEIIQGEPVLIHCEILPSNDCTKFGKYREVKPSSLLACVSYKEVTPCMI